VQLTPASPAARLILGPLNRRMATIDEDLGQLERDIRQLKIEYEQYFGGGRSRPPTDIEWRIEQVVKRYSERSSNMNFAQRFRFSSLSQTSARFRDVFRKRLKQKEEGVVPRHYGAAAKAIEAERAARQTTAPATSSGVERSTPPSASTSNVDRDQDKTRKLYESFLQAKKESGEKAENLTPEAFQEFLRRKSQELRKKTGEDEVEFFVSVEKGQVKLKARVSPTAKAKS
jgi:hypothetical protein